MSTSTVETSPVQVGDFFVSSWGYDQTNIDFYKVVGVTPSGKSVKVQQWQSKVVSEVGGPSESVVPGDSPATRRVRKAGVTPEQYEAMDFWDRQDAHEDVSVEVETKRIRVFGPDSVYFTVNSYSSARKWDGGTESRTGSGWGH